jgi:uncharacterized protein (TIGR03435 family)
MRPILLLLLAVALGGAQTRFEVASVRASVWRPAAAAAPGERGTGGGCPTSLKLDRGRIDIHCATLAMLIGYAFRFSPDRVQGPDWMMSVGSPRFDLAATLPAGAAAKQAPEMVQTLLADRFKLAIHRGTVERAILALVVAKGGLKLKETAASGSSAADSEPVAGALGFYGETQDSTTPDGAVLIRGPRIGTVRQTEGPDRLQRWESAVITFDGLADLLDHVAPLPSPVVNMTGLRGRYPLALEVSLNELSRPGRAPDGGDIDAAILTAFNDGLRKLGLQLERRKGPVGTVVVEHVEKTPTEN